VAVSTDFTTTIRDAYAIDGPAIVLGRGVHGGAVSHEAVVQIPLAMMNRHGLVAGATGTGKAKTLQVLAEQLSAAGVPVFVADVKGDVSGLIRSKGIGVFFVTQTPKDVPGDVLGQLGNRVQHALRAFTPEDAKALKATGSTFPRSELYDVQELLPALGIGEAAVTILSESGVPTPVVHTRMVAPRSRMAPADDVAALATASPLCEKYGARLERESARELLAARMAHVPVPRRRRRPAPKPSGGGGDAVGDFLTSRQGKVLQRQVLRGVFGMLRRRL
jgi:DNA double-strand break repair helicase HerA and related ATPase